MCLIAWRWQPDAQEPLLLLANRDEFYARPTQPLTIWSECEMVAGRDLEGGGTWLGLDPSGRLAALTNFRSPKDMRAGTPSRGEIVCRFLQGSLSAQEFLSDLSQTSHAFNPFNLLVYDGTSLWGAESRAQSFRSLHLPQGIGSVSNAGFQSAWPKMRRLEESLRSCLLTRLDSDEILLNALLDTHQAPDTHLPQTGIPVDRERDLSSIFIRLNDYGTRSSSIVRVGRDRCRFVESRFDAYQQIGQTVIERPVVPRVD